MALDGLAILVWPINVPFRYLVVVDKGDSLCADLSALSASSVVVKQSMATVMLAPHMMSVYFPCCVQ